MSKKVLIIGGLGYIGSILYEYIKSEGWDVNIFDNHLYFCIKPVYEFIFGDVRDEEKLEPIIKEHDVIINLAAIVGDPACLIDTNMAIEINCTGMKNVVKICKKYNKYIIHFSTCSIYGSEPNHLMSEQDDGFPIDFYGQTKYTQERLVREICINSCIFRLGTAFGLSPRMRYDLVVNSFAAKAVRDKKIIIFGGDQERPFIHIRDISRATVHAIKHNLIGLYNLRGENMSLIKLGNIVKEITGCEIEIQNEIIDKRSYMVDNSKIVKTGFEIKYTIIDAIKEIVASPSIFEMDKIIYSNQKLVESIRNSSILSKKQLQVIEGGISVDDRGAVSFANGFNFAGVKRFYQVQNFSKNTIRAFHGHMNEGKFVYVSKGSAIIAVVKINDTKSPSKCEKVNRYILSDKTPRIIFIPPKHANGFKSLQSDTIILFFSTSLLEESNGDDYRFPADYWGMEVWKVENH